MNERTDENEEYGDEYEPDPSLLEILRRRPSIAPNLEQDEENRDSVVSDADAEDNNQAPMNAMEVAELPNVDENVDGTPEDAQEEYEEEYDSVSDPPGLSSFLDRYNPAAAMMPPQPQAQPQSDTVSFVSEAPSDVSSVSRNTTGRVLRNALGVPQSSMEVSRTHQRPSMRRIKSQKSQGRSQLAAAVAAHLETSSSELGIEITDSTEDDAASPFEQKTKKKPPPPSPPTPPTAQMAAQMANRSDEPWGKPVSVRTDSDPAQSTRVFRLLDLYANITSSRKPKTEDEAGRRYREQHDRFNVVDQGNNLMQTKEESIAWNRDLHESSKKKKDGSSVWANFSSVNLDLSDNLFGRRISSASKHNVDKKDDPKKRRLLGSILRWIGFILLLIATITLIVILARQGHQRRANRRKSASATTSIGAGTAPPSVAPPTHTVHLHPPDQEPETLRIEVLKQRILEAGLGTSAQFSDLHSVQFYALRWLSDSDTAEIPLDDDRILQRYALAVFCYSQINNGNTASRHSSGEWWVFHNTNDADVFQHWMSEMDFCEWKGVQCYTHPESKTSSVRALNMTSTRIRGSLPTELDALTDLRVLDLSRNLMDGTIPQYKQLTTLRVLNLERNGFTGSIPSLHSLPNIEIIHLNNNNLRGHIPKQLNNLTSIVELKMANNHLTGTIPQEIELLTTLRELTVQSNNLKGPLPALESFTNLESLLMGRNAFSGTLPESWKNLQSLKTLILNTNQVTGSIPKDFGRMRDLEFLWLNENILTGTIPTKLGDLSQLRNFFLDKNYLDGTIPTELGLLNSIESVRMGVNTITGEVPEEVCNLKDQHNLRFLSLDCVTLVECACCDECS